MKKLEGMLADKTKDIREAIDKKDEGADLNKDQNDLKAIWADNDKKK